MTIFDWFAGDNVDRENNIVVKTGANSKCSQPTPSKVNITVGDIKEGKVTDSFGHTSEVVLFLRRGKK